MYCHRHPSPLGLVPNHQIANSRSVVDPANQSSLGTEVYCAKGCMWLGADGVEGKEG